MNSKHKERNKSDKMLFAARIILSVAVILFSVFQLSGIWDHAMDLAIPLMGIVSLIQAVQEWKKNRAAAIFELFVALFVLGCAVAVWFIR